MFCSRSWNLHHPFSSLLYFLLLPPLRLPSFFLLVPISVTARILRSNLDSPGCLPAPTCCLHCNTKSQSVHQSFSFWDEIWSGDNFKTHSEKPFHLRRYSTLPFTTRRFSTFSTTYSSSSSSSSGTSSGFFSFSADVNLVLSAGSDRLKILILILSGKQKQIPLEILNFNQNLLTNYVFMLKLYTKHEIIDAFTMTHTLPHNDKQYKRNVCWYFIYICISFFYFFPPNLPTQWDHRLRVL